MPNIGHESEGLRFTMPEHSQQPRAWSLATILTEACASWPERPAAVDVEGRTLTYRDLYLRSRRLAERLLAEGVAPGDRVGVAASRSLDTLVAIFGASMSGATYVPLDPTQPLARLRFLIDDAKVGCLIAPRELAASCGIAPELAFELEGLAQCTAGVSAASLPLPSVSPRAIAYVMYTSGSTGRPKGVQIEHGSLRAFFDTHNERASIAPGDRCLNSSPLYFDASLLDVFLPLYAGATVFFGSELPIPRLALRAIEHHRITHFYAVGTVLAMLTGDGSELDRHDLGSLCLLQTGAEICNVRVVNQWLSRYPALRFLNSYGPTEVTVGCVSYLKPGPGPLSEDSCPIGAPHTGTLACLLAEDGSVVHELGVIGELLLGGDQLMRGYLDRPAEDAKAFIEVGGVRYYRTGDFASRDDDGRYHFVGRRDDEIKLNGYRIHLNEVQRCITDEPRVESAVAAVISDNRGERVLGTAVVTSAPVDEALAAAIQKHVSSLLPGPMQPRRWAFFSAFPRLASGKIDREACFARLSRAIATADARFYKQSGEELQPLVNP